MRHTIRNASLLALALAVAGCAGNPELTDSSSELGDNATASAASSTSNDVDPNAVKCRVTTPTGSRIGQKVCKTNAEWDAAAREARDAASTIQRESLQGQGRSDGG